MARIVTITQPADTVRCGPDGRAEYVFTIHNISGAPLRVGAQLQVDEPTQKSWLNIQGPSERDLDENASEQITVQAQVPPDTNPGKYKFRLLVYSVRRPGEDYTEGETVALEVPPKEKKPKPAPPPKKFPWWIPAAVAVLLIGGVIAWLFWPTDIEVPNVEEETLTDARTILENAGLKVSDPIAFQQTSKQPPNTILEQQPKAGEMVKEGTGVHLTVAEEKRVQVPNLVGQRLATALRRINSIGLGLGDIKEQTLKDKPVGTVLGQMPKPNAQVGEGTKINLTVSKEPGKVLVLDAAQIQILKQLQTDKKLDIPMKLMREVPEESEATPDEE